MINLKSVLFVLALLIHTTSVAGANPKACSNADQKNMVFKNNHAFAEALKECSSLDGLGRKCFADKYPKLSAGCLKCFEAMTLCSVQNCKGSCMFSPRGESCSQCSMKHCGASMRKCSGMATKNLPGFKP